jgi:hypothetical protein
MRRTVLAFITGIISASTWARSAAAVTDIRFERWTIRGIRRDVVAPVESTTAIGVYFDAIVTAGDLAHGLRPRSPSATRWQ